MFRRLSERVRLLGLGMAPSHSPVPPRSRSERLVKDWLIPLLSVAAIVSPLRSVVADWNDVPSGSMRPTILEGDRITVNKLAFGLRVPFTGSWILTWGEPQRGDIVTFASPADGTRLVKRIVGLPGDRIAMRAGRLLVNNEPVAYGVIDPHHDARLPSGIHTDAILASESLAEHPHQVLYTPGVPAVRDFNDVIVPENSYFMLGDNRDMSNDSRAYGPVKRSSVYGRVGFVALSLNPFDGYAPRWSRWFSTLR